MQLQPIDTTADEVSKQVARQVLQQVVTTATQIAKIRKEGIPAVAARPEQVLPDGRKTPAVAARPAITGADVDKALGATNVAILSALSTALGM